MRDLPSIYGGVSPAPTCSAGVLCSQLEKPRVEGFAGVKQFTNSFSVVFFSLFLAPSPPMGPFPSGTHVKMRCLKERSLLQNRQSTPTVSRGSLENELLSLHLFSASFFFGAYRGKTSFSVAAGFFRGVGMSHFFLIFFSPFDIFFSFP